MGSSHFILNFMLPSHFEAINYAVRAHAKQKRKYTDEPYAVHCINVMATVHSNITCVDTAAITAAPLHDIVEDINDDIYNLENIRIIFGTQVAQIVNELTDKYTHKSFPDLNREERKKREAERFEFVTPEAVFVKLADLIDNTKSIVACDPGFARVYLKEKKRMLDIICARKDFTDYADIRHLHQIASNQVGVSA